MKICLFLKYSVVRKPTIANLLQSFKCPVFFSTNALLIPINNNENTRYSHLYDTKQDNDTMESRKLNLSIIQIKS